MVAQATVVALVLEAVHRRTGTASSLATHEGAAWMRRFVWACKLWHRRVWHTPNHSRLWEPVEGTGAATTIVAGRHTSSVPMRASGRVCRRV